MYLTLLAKLLLERLHWSELCFTRSGMLVLPDVLNGSCQHQCYEDSGPVFSLPELQAASLVWLREDRKVPASADCCKGSAPALAADGCIVVESLPSVLQPRVPRNAGCKTQTHKANPHAFPFRMSVGDFAAGKHFSLKQQIMSLDSSSTELRLAHECHHCPVLPWALVHVQP